MIPLTDRLTQAQTQEQQIEQQINAYRQEIERWAQQLWAVRGQIALLRELVEEEKQDA